MRSKNFLKTILKEEQMVEREKFLEESKGCCPFCNIIENPTNERKKDVILETDNFLAIIDIAPPVDNYFVLFPKSHALSYFELDPVYEQEYHDVINTISNATGNHNWIAFENGAGNRNGNGYGVVSYQSVYHCHMNFVGIPEGEHGMWDFIENRFRSLQQQEDDIVFQYDNYLNGRFPVPLLREHTQGEPYFYQQMGQQVRIVKETTDEKLVPSQFVRKAIVQYVNRDMDSPFWDWKNIDPAYQAVIDQRREKMKLFFS